MKLSPSAFPTHSVYVLEAYQSIEPSCIALNAIQRRVRPRLQFL